VRVSVEHHAARVLARAGCTTELTFPHWRVLAAHLALFDYAYPGERAQVPRHMRQELLQRLEEDSRAPAALGRICRGTLLSREQYLIDVARWGYVDARVGEGGAMTAEEVERWTASIGTDC
jgi:hypothetical protein